MIVRIILLVALLGAAAVVLYGLFLDRTGQTIALTVAGLVVLGVTSAIISVGLAVAAIGAGRDGRGLKALGEAFLGGLFAFVVAGSLATAIMLGTLGLG